MDAADVSGKYQSDSGLARNGEVHKYQLDSRGIRRGIKEYVPPSSSDSNPFMLRINTQASSGRRIKTKCLLGHLRATAGRQVGKTPPNEYENAMIGGAHGEFA